MPDDSKTTPDGAAASSVPDPINLYAVYERREISGGTMVLVAALGSERALELIRASGLDWNLGNTRTNRLWRNIDRTEGIVDVFGMHKFSAIRRRDAKPGRSRDAGTRRRERRERGGEIHADSSPAARTNGDVNV
jgi:hypothetical protein